jgi:riboflavin kinase
MAKTTKITQQQQRRSAHTVPQRLPSLKRIKLTGTVFTGNGEGKKHLILPWVKRQIEEALGYTPYPGTLNLQLSKENAKHRKQLETANATRICPVEGYCSGILHKAHIGKLECAIVIPEVATYPQDYLEIIAPDHLRTQLNLKDGDEVTITADL